jgi:GNAT superfamily N-acetyltransferase
LIRKKNKTLHSIAPPNNTQLTIELATVRVDDEYQSRGHFKRFLRIVENFCLDRGLSLYVENVMVEGDDPEYGGDPSLYCRFIKFFAKRGYQVDRQDDESVSYFASTETLIQCTCRV